MTPSNHKCVSPNANPSRSYADKIFSIRLCWGLVSDRHILHSLIWPRVIFHNMDPCVTMQSLMGYLIKSICSVCYSQRRTNDVKTFSNCRPRSGDIVRHRAVRSRAPGIPSTHRPRRFQNGLRRLSCRNLKHLRPIDLEQLNFNRPRHYPRRSVWLQRQESVGAQDCPEMDGDRSWQGLDNLAAPQRTLVQWQAGHRRGLRLRVDAYGFAGEYRGSHLGKCGKLCP